MLSDGTELPYDLFLGVRFVTGAVAPAIVTGRR